MEKFYELGFGKQKLTVALDDKNVIAELRPICSRTCQQLPMDTIRCQRFVPDRRPVSLPEPACAFPTLTGGSARLVPENRLYREQIGAEVRPCDAAF